MPFRSLDIAMTPTMLTNLLIMSGSIYVVYQLFRWSRLSTHSLWRWFMIDTIRQNFRSSMRDLDPHGDTEFLSLGMEYSKFKFQIQALSMLSILKQQSVIAPFFGIIVHHVRMQLRLYDTRQRIHTYISIKVTKSRHYERHMNASLFRLVYRTFQSQLDVIHQCTKSNLDGQRPREFEGDHQSESLQPVATVAKKPSIMHAHAGVLQSIYGEKGNVIFQVQIRIQARVSTVPKTIALIRVP
jgi:hypothetical protein